MAPRVSGYSKLAVAFTLAVCTCSQGLLMEGSKRGGKYPYNSSTVPLLAELVKLVMSCCLLYRGLKKDPRGTVMTTDWRSVILFPIPSIIYVVHNNIQFYTMQYVDAATYQILGNLKIVTTGVLFRIALNRHLTRTQWIALLLLTMGATTSQIGGCGGETALSAPLMGYALGCLSACLSATAGVYTEFLLKRNGDSLYWQNAQLYFFGVLFNALNLTLEDFSSGFKRGFWLRSGLRGYNGVTWLIVVNFSFSGLFVSWLQKHADTIVKVYSTSSAMLLTALVSLLFFRLEPTLQLFIGIVVACCSLSLYFVPPELEGGGGGGQPPLLPLTHAGNGLVEVHCPKCFAVSAAVLPRGFAAAAPVAAGGGKGGAGSAVGPSGRGGGGGGGAVTGHPGHGGAAGAAGPGLPPMAPAAGGASLATGGAPAAESWAGAGVGGGGASSGGAAVVVNTQAEPFSSSSRDAARRSPSAARRFSYNH